MKKQKYTFLEGEGDRWFERNRDHLINYSINTDHVVGAMRKHGIVPKRAVEFGCSNGARLAALRDAYGCDIMGVDPSREALQEAANRRVPAIQSTASSPALQAPFDLVIYGFCLYLTDPEDWLQIAAEGNNVLSVGGHLIVHDFEPPEDVFTRNYKHRDGVLSYHFDFASLWVVHPQYRVIHRELVADDEFITILRKEPRDIMRRRS